MSAPSSSPTPASPAPDSSLPAPVVAASSPPLLWTVPSPFDATLLHRFHDPSQHDLYFAYGSNLNVERMGARKVAFVERGMSARLEGYALTFNKIASVSDVDSSKKGAIGYANLVPSDAHGAAAYGVLYILPRCKHVPSPSHPSGAQHIPGGLFLLDVFEGVASGHYARTRVHVTLQDGSRVEATTYLACNGSYSQDVELSPTRTYLDHLLAGRALLPDHYHHSLSCTPLSWMPDPMAHVDRAQSLLVSDPCHPIPSTTGHL